MIKLQKDYLEISDEKLIQELISLGAGIEESGKARIPLLEAAYFADKKIIELDRRKILEKLKKRDKLSEDRYKVLKFLRDRGYITRVSLDTEEYFRVHQKGIRVGEDRTKYVLKVVPKNWKTDLKEIKKSIEFAGRLRKKLVFAYVNGKDVNFIKISRKNFE